MIKHAPAPFYPLTLQFNQPHSVYRETTCHMVAIVPCHWILLTAHSQAWIVFDGLSSSSLLFFFFFFLSSNRAITTVNKHRNRHMHSLSWLLCWCISVIYPPRPGWWSRDWKICHGIAVHLPTTPFAQPTRVLKMVNVYFIIIRGKQYGWGHASVVCCFDNAQRLMVFEYYFVRGKGFRTRLLQFKIRFLYYYRLKKRLRERFEVDNFDILVLLININFYRVGIFSRAILFNYSF